MTRHGFHSLFCIGIIDRQTKRTILNYRVAMLRICKYRDEIIKEKVFNYLFLYKDDYIHF